MDALASVGWPVVDRIFHIGDFSVSPHGIGIAAGFLAGSWWVMRTGPSRGVAAEHLSNMLFWALIGAIIGSRLFYVIGHWSEFDGIGEVFALQNGGFSLIGGIAGAVLIAVPFMRRYGYRFFQAMDCAFLGFPFGIAVGRSGDLIIGDHLGKPTSWLLAWTYEGGSLAPPFHCTGTAPAEICTAALQGGHSEQITRGGAQLAQDGAVIATGIGVHQTAMYDMLWCILLFVGLFLFARAARRREGVLILTFAILYGLGRVVTDYLRIDKRVAFGMTGSQITSLTVVVISICILVYWAIRKPPDPGRRVATRFAPGEPSTTFTPPTMPTGS